MLKHIGYVLCGLGVSMQSMSMTCYLTIVKDSCWVNYNVTTIVKDTSNGVAVASVVVPKNRTWVRVKFPCQSEQTFSFQAQYSPVMWQGTEGQQYNAQNYWQLPMLTAATPAQSLALCYGRDFSEVPIPPSAKGQCSCDMSSLPAVKL